MSYELDVLVNGKSVVKYPWRDHVFLEGREGTEYTIRFRNNSSNRVLAVMSVDGLSIMNGEEADLDGMGYVVEPWTTLDVPGWRLDNEAVASFKFGKRGKAYADKKGKGGNVGVIGCAVFKSKDFDFGGFRIDPYTGPLRSTKDVVGKTTVTWTDSSLVDSSTSCTYSTCDSHTSTNGNSSEMAVAASSGDTITLGSTESLSSYYVDSDTSTSRGAPSGIVEVDPSPQHLGTEFGKRRRDVVQEVVFNRADKPEVIFELHYDSRKGLEQRGIKVGKKPRHVARAFKGSKGMGCKPPAGWRGHPLY